MSSVRVGLSVLGVLAVAVYLAFGGPLPFSHTYTVDAVVQSANELHGGSPVRIAGVNVGKVVATGRYKHTNLSVITLRIDDNGQPTGPERICTPLGEPGSTQFLTLTFALPSSAVEGGYEFTVPGSDATLPVVVP